ncbi:Arylphorin subunit alpha [Papilio xuthus]|uniref:Arylphorin subunit alpha n=1 Tax=Papilio xuthus TaxID=66420 RepID=A0A194PUN5_PAPXU|nr:Arylphorin subunit alpha [Papilio xuthus]
MFQLTLLVLAAVSLGTSGYLIKVPTTPWQPRTVPVQKQEWVYFQRRLMPLFENVCEDSNDLLITSLSNDFANDYGNGNYLNPDVITTLQNYKSSKGFLPKGEIFTEYNQDHVAELKIIFEVLYFAKDFETFYKAAAWARQNINCGIYVDAIYLAVLNRKDTEKVSIPPPYELLPNYFVNKEAIIKGSLLLSDEEWYITENVREQGNSYIVDAEYSNGPYETTQESLTYFNEDVGLNTYYYLNKLNSFPWLNVSLGIRPKLGENLYHTLKQLATRYNLERYSNDLPELENFDWNTKTMIPYYSTLIYSNGKDFAQSNLADLLDSEDFTLLRNIEENIVTVATHMRDKGFAKEDIINHLMDILVISSKSYQNLAYKLLGTDFTSEQRLPSVLAHYLTTVRDPMFWKINKKIVDLVDCALSVLPGYSRNDLIFPGVEIVNVDIKKMMTSFEYFEFDATDALKTSASNSKFLVKIGQYRLNHKPFSIKLNISSLVTQKGFAKLFISPKVLPGQMGQMKNLFFMLDCFEINLKRGKNMITRTSDEMKLSPDLTSLKIIKKQLEDAEFGLNALPLKTVESQTGFPSRLVLPKGSENGLPFQIFVFIAPYIKPAVNGRFANVEYNFDAMLNPGYPLDLNINMHQLLDLPNALIKDVIITHKVENKPVKEVVDVPESSNTWSSNEIEPMGLLKSPARPSFNANKQPFDYKSKKGQYGKKEDYLAKRTNYKVDTQDTSEIPTSYYAESIKNQFIDESEEDISKTLYNINSMESDFSEKPKNEEEFDEILKKSSEIQKPLRILKLSARPDFTMKREPFDYKSKRGQYGKKDDYSTKRGNYTKKWQDNFKETSTENVMDISTNKEVRDLEIKVKEDLNTNEKDFEKIIYTSNDDKNVFKNVIKETEKTDSLQNPTKDLKEEYNVDDIMTEPTVVIISKKRNPTVYDFLFTNPFDNFDSTEEKVYY